MYVFMHMHIQSLGKSIARGPANTEWGAPVFRYIYTHTYMLFIFIYIYIYIPISIHTYIYIGLARVAGKEYREGAGQYRRGCARIYVYV